jgi:hypothetical protein
MYQYKILEVLRVIDGDTVDVMIDLGFNIRMKQRIRLSLEEFLGSFMLKVTV